MYDEFKNITGFDLEDYFRRFTEFVSNDSQEIMNYYSGLTENLDRDAFGEYESLVKEADSVINLFDLNMERFNTVDFWILMEFADDIKIKLETIGNFSKFSRSSVKKESFSNEVSIPTSTRDNETIEEMMTRFGSTDRDNDWVDVALSNAIIQEDYTLDGGVVLNINFKNNSRFIINSVIDNPDGDTIKGKDIDKYLQFVDNDLKILGFDDTLQQNMEILVNLKKNDNPEFPQYGIDKTLVLGMSLKAVALPSLVRQIFQTFSTDDIVKQVQLLRTTIDQDSLHMDLNIVIQSGQEQKRTLSVNGN